METDGTHNTRCGFVSKCELHVIYKTNVLTLQCLGIGRHH